MTKRVITTVATRSHLAFARALAISRAQSNPGVPVYVLLADGKPGEDSDASEPFELIFPSQLPDQAAIRRMSFYYTPFEFCNGLRGHLGLYVLREIGADEWVYLDSDIMVLGSLQPIWDQLAQSPILVTPHLSTPVPESSVFPTELQISMHGVFNSGFLALRKCEETEAFYRWFSDRLSRFCFVGEWGNFVDQTWLTLAPCLFPSTQMCRHSGVNIGHWNLHERHLSQAPDGSFTSNGEKIVCVHFSGWDFMKPTEVSKYAPAYLRPAPAGWQALGLKYRDLLVSARYDPARVAPYGYANFNDGRPITNRMRRGYRDEYRRGDGADDPFTQSSHFYRQYSDAAMLVRRLNSSARQLMRWVASKMPGKR
jgi:hypothetical protein